MSASNYIIHINFTSIDTTGIIMPKVKIECLEVPKDTKGKREIDDDGGRETKRAR